MKAGCPTVSPATHKTTALVVSILTVLTLAACGSANPLSPTTPPAPAQIVEAGGFAVSTCQPAAGTKTCASYTALMTNMGTGCAANVHGTTTIFADLSTTVISTNEWTYTGTVQPGATFTFTGGPITVPATGTYGFIATAAWTDVACR